MFLLGCGSAFAQGAGMDPDAAAADAASHQVLDLSAAWRLALRNDHTFLAAVSEQAATQTERRQGLAGLLPRIHAGYRNSWVTGDVAQYDLSRRTSSALDYDSLNAYVQIQQPLVNAGKYARYRRGEARAELGTAVLQARYEATGIRLAETYFNALLAYEGYVLQRSLVASLDSKATAIAGLFRRQEASRIDVQETQSRLAVARADLIGAEDQWVLALRELQALLGVAPTHLKVLRDDIPLPPLDPATLGEWLDIARMRNAEVEVARRAVRVASVEVDVAAGEYVPTADLVASYGRAKSESLSSLSQRTNTFSVGIQVSIPLFAGGYNRANVSRARSERSRLQHELRAAIERTQAEVTRQYANVLAGADLVNALRDAEQSGQMSLASVRKGYAVGVSSNLDVLEVLDRLHQTRHELAKAQLDYVLARLRLTVAAGMQEAGTFNDINDLYLGPAVAVSGQVAASLHAVLMD